MFIVLFQDLINTNLNTIPKSHMVFSVCVSVYGMRVCVKCMCVLYILLCVYIQVSKTCTEARRSHGVSSSTTLFFVPLEMESFTKSHFI